MTSPSQRTIIIGDIHGCYDELMDLLRLVQAGPTDKLICVGDLICKGPDSLGVMKWAMETPNVRCIVGNHEARFLRCWKKGVIPDIKPYDLETVRQLGAHYEESLRFMDSWSLSIEGEGFLVVHAGIDSRKPLKDQDPLDLTELRALPDLKKPWYEIYEEERLIVFGHWARRDPVLRTNAIGLDTGCVYGNRLSAIVLPERRLVSVPARKVYREKTWKPEASQL